MICRYCNANCNKEDEYCKNCGRRLPKTELEIFDADHSIPVDERNFGVVKDHIPNKISPSRSDAMAREASNEEILKLRKSVEELKNSQKRMAKRMNSMILIAVTIWIVQLVVIFGFMFLSHKKLNNQIEKANEPIEAESIEENFNPLFKSSEDISSEDESSGEELSDEVEFDENKVSEEVEENEINSEEDLMDRIEKIKGDVDDLYNKIQPINDDYSKKRQIIKENSTQIGQCLDELKEQLKDGAPDHQNCININESMDKVNEAMNDIYSTVESKMIDTDVNRYEEANSLNKEIQKEWESISAYLQKEYDLSLENTDMEEEQSSQNDSNDIDNSESGQIVSDDDSSGNQRKTGLPEEDTANRYDEKAY